MPPSVKQSGFRAEAKAKEKGHLGKEAEKYNSLSLFCFLFFFYVGNHENVLKLAFVLFDFNTKLP